MLGKMWSYTLQFMASMRAQMHLKSTSNILGAKPFSCGVFA